MRWGTLVFLPAALLSVAFAADGEAAATAGGYDLLNPAEMVLAVDNNGTRFSWELEYGQARQRAIAFLEAGDPESALAAAKAQFLLCPLDETSLTAAIMSVSEALEALDGESERAAAFEKFARFGTAGEDGEAGTADDLSDPLAGVAPQFPREEDAYYAEVDATMDARARIGQEWQARWYETEKVFARLDGGLFDEALSILVPVLAESVKHPAANIDGDWELQRNQDIMDRIDAALGVIHRSRTGTAAGVGRFVSACKEYVLYGPAGADDTMGTEDDLEPPI